MYKEAIAMYIEAGREKYLRFFTSSATIYILK